MVRDLHRDPRHFPEAALRVGVGRLNFCSKQPQTTPEILAFSEQGQIQDLFYLGWVPAARDEAGGAAFSQLLPPSPLCQGVLGQGGPGGGDLDTTSTQTETQETGVLKDHLCLLDEGEKLIIVGAEEVASGWRCLYNQK